ncbi:MAG: hypothetical protein AB8B53_14815 [Flavobacteriales bacterium]
MKLPFVLVIIVIGFSVGCGANSAEMPSTSNSDSELTLLMRQMYEDAITVKQAILANNPLVLLNHEAVLTAQSTQPEKAQSELYQTFVSDYLTKLKLLNKAESLEQKVAFSNVVKSCINCHSSLCPGPLVKIDKLKWN